MISVMKLQHTSVPMPPGSSQQARAFYGDVIGMTEISPPASLADRELVWFRAGNDAEVHLFADSEMNAKSSAQHLCLQVEDIEAHRQRFADAGVEIEETTPITNRPRFNVHDPFGNLLEITQIIGDYE